MKLQVGRNQILKGLVCRDKELVVKEESLKGRRQFSQMCFRSLAVVAMVGLGLEAESIQSYCLV